MGNMHEQFYRSLYRIRKVEEEVARIYPSDKIKSPIHLSIGQEAISVGVCEALRKTDVIFGTYRGHAAYLAKGGDLKAMVAELYGKDTGCARGKGGSMHLIDAAAGVMGASAVVGTGIPQAAGYAYAMKIRREQNVVVCFFGDGAVEEGVFHETMNFAALKKLPVFFVCENNFYSIHTPQAHRQPSTDICRWVRGYDIPVDRIEDGDTLRIHRAACAAVARMRNGEGPQFLECFSYRWKEHVGPNEDYDKGYRSREEADPWMKNDQVRLMGEALDAAMRRRIESEVGDEIKEAFEFAEGSPFPADEELYADVFKEA
jgi:TPP-dependent pyruvate/acetoin dehydrogenase alpha subunit